MAGWVRRLFLAISAAQCDAKTYRFNFTSARAKKTDAVSVSEVQLFKMDGTHLQLRAARNPGVYTCAATSV